jgi:hypothetical protein
MSRDASFGIAGSCENFKKYIPFKGTSPLREQPILQSTPERSHSASGINNYGYDLQEGWVFCFKKCTMPQIHKIIQIEVNILNLVHTNHGGAQIVHTYGAGNVFDDSPMRDRSLDASLRPILNPILNASASPSSHHHATFEMPQPQSILKNTQPYSSEEK